MVSAAACLNWTLINNANCGEWDDTTGDCSYYNAAPPTCTTAPAAWTGYAAACVDPTAPAITLQPSNQSVVVGQTATFTITATGNPSPTYQWQKNGIPISGATAASYTTPPTTLADNGATFRCVVSNSAGNVTSNAATLTVSTTLTPSAPSNDLAGAYAYPVPYKPSSGHTDIIFAGVTAASTVRIYTVGGELVKELSNILGGTSITWAGVKNADGESVASGVYIFKIKSPGGEKRGKLVIVR